MEAGEAGAQRQPVALVQELLEDVVEQPVVREVGAEEVEEATIATPSG